MSQPKTYSIWSPAKGVDNDSQRVIVVIPTVPNLTEVYLFFKRKFRGKRLLILRERDENENRPKADLK